MIEAEEEKEPVPAKALETLQTRRTSLTQLHLDFGQKNFHASKCPTCGLLYTQGQADDELIHAEYHSHATQGLKYTPSTSERIVRDDENGKIVMFDSTDSTKGKRLEQLTQFLEDQMGLVKGWLVAVPVSIFLQVSPQRKILGCIVLERIKEAHYFGQPMNSTSTVRATFGVRVMWVSMNARRKGIATSVLDVARVSAMPGYVAPRSALAFSQPTSAGQEFIKKYIGSNAFLIYEPNQ